MASAAVAKSPALLTNAPGADALAPMRLLVVDDHRANRTALSTCLMSWRLKVDCACSGPNALERLRQAVDSDQPYTLVLLDHHMPDMNGLAVAQVIKTDPALSSIPLALMSADSQNAAQYLNFSAYLKKPIRTADLYACLQRFATA